MSSTDNWGSDFSIKTTYTFNEAIEYMKLRDKYPTNTTISWVNAKTKEPVSIGYTSGL